MPASALMNVMTKAARKAGRTLSRDFGEVEHLQVATKGPADFVSKADLRAEKIIFEELSHARPNYCFLLEEGGIVEGSDKTHRWIIDPLDGTTNFLHGIPHFAISIALERDGELVAGLVYNPVMEELFTAEKGAGAYLNDRRIRVGGRNKLEDAVVVTGIPHRGKSGKEVFIQEMRQVTRSVVGIRRTGSAAVDLSWVAAGRFDGYWERGIQAWDMAAGIVLVREAGGRVTDAQGGDDMLTTGSVVAGNTAISTELQKTIIS
ncbi:MAG: inositol monophosphatase [Hyphomicrobiaceae bacterium]|nr:inositol monophosphatase [Hyphomicrobiaceae bacterium]